MSEKTTSLPEDLYGRRMLSQKQVCELLDCGRTGLYALLKQKNNALPSKKIKGRRKYPVDQVLWWIENQGS